MNRRLVIIVAVAFVAVLAVGMYGLLFPFAALPGEYTISSAGVTVTSGGTVDYLDGLVLTMDYQGLDPSADNICNLWDIEESLTVEVGSFSVDNYGAAVWAFTLDDVRNDTNPYKLVLAGDLEGESFTFYIMGEEGEEEPPPPPPFEDPVISDIEVSATSPNVGEDITIKFTVETYVNYEWDFKVDDVVVESDIISTSGGNYRIDIHEFVDTQAVDGIHIYSLHLSYVDGEGESVSVSDSIDVTWIGTMPTTTTTTTTTDTTTTPTTTTEPPPDEYDPGFLFVVAGIGLVVIVAIVCKAAK